jgi:hypothetical protein
MIMYMTSKKQSRKNKSRSNIKKRRQSRQRRQQQPFFIGGTCASCGACMQQNNGLSPLFKGGKTCTIKHRSGGNDASFNGTLSQRHYYGLNSHNQDPNSPNMQMAVRQQPNIRGGKNQTKKASKRGGFNFSWFNGQTAGPSSYNPLHTVGDMGTSQIASNYISGNIGSKILPNPSVLSQPVDSKYNTYNMPLA